MVINMCEYNNVPKIRFKGFTDVWEQRKLGEISNIVGGGTPSTEVESYWNGNINWYSPAEIGSQIYVSNSQRKITELGLEKSSARLLPVGTVLFTSRAGIGNMAILKEKACTNQGFQSIIPIKNMLNSYFIFSRSNELKKYAETVGAGSTFVEVSGKQMSEMEIKIPKIKEQVRIADLFTNLDNLITLHQRKCDTLVNAKKSLLEKMFPKNSSNIPEIRFKEFTDVWEQRKLEDITQIVMGQSPDSINYTDNSDDTVLIQGNADLNNGIVVPRIWSSQITKKSYPNDIIFTVRAPVGEIARNPYFATIGRGVASFKGNDFLYQSLIQKKENNYWNNISAGSTFDSINSDQLKNVIIYLPKNNLEQEKIGELFTNLDNLITLHQRKLEKLKNIKKSMLDKMFV